MIEPIFRKVLLGAIATLILLVICAGLAFAADPWFVIDPVYFALGWILGLALCSVWMALVRWRRLRKDAKRRRALIRRNVGGSYP